MVALVIKEKIEPQHYQNIYKVSNNQMKTKLTMIYKNIAVDAGFKFDGVSIPWFATWLFTVNDIKKGDVAACFHDWMCGRPHLYKRKYATHILVKLWKMAGLPSWKAPLVYVFVELYQLFQKGKWQ